MEKKFNPLDLTQVSKKQLDRSKRIEEQAADFLKLHDKKLIEDAALLEKKKHEALASGAMFSKNSSYVKNKNRAKAVQEAIGYTDRAARSAMTDIMSTIVEGALLLDTAEYAKLNPEYKKMIKETVSELLEKGKIEKVVKNKKTLKVMDHVAKAIPDVKTGVYLKEEELIDIVRKSTPAEINNVISSLTGDVKERVANLVVKEQDDAAEIQKEIAELSNVPASQPEVVAAPAPAAMPEQPEAEEINSDEELMAMQQQPGIQNPAPEFDEFDQEIEKQEPQSKKTEVEVAPDGTVKVNIVREKFYREHPRQGVLESLALNEALDMVKAGKPYNGDLALANALTHLTVMEAFNATGLIPISELDYARMLNIPLAEAKKKLGAVAAKPVHSNKKPVEHKPEVKEKEVLKGEQKANEVKAPLIEAKKSWKDKVKDTMAKQEAEKPWNKKMAEAEKHQGKK